MTPESGGQQDLKAYLKIFWRWKLLFLAFLVVVPVAVYLLERGKPKIYRSQTLIELRDVSVNLGSTSAPIVTGNIDAVARLVSTTPVADAAARFLRPRPINPRSLLSEVSATADSNTGFVTITAQAHDPDLAATIANAFAAALADHQSGQAILAINQQIRAAVKQLAAIPPSDQVDRASLSAQIARLKGLRGATTSGAQVIESAVPSRIPVGPKTRQAVELAIIIGLLLGFGAVLLAENGDRRLRRPSDLETLTNWPLLAVIPASAFNADKPASPHDLEAFQMLQGVLRYFNVERPHRSVAIISPLLGDGKTTVAVGLALATARAGKRAVLVDADLRRAGVSARLGIAATSGLGAVLAGERNVEEVAFENPAYASEGGRLLVIPAGPPPPNPSALLSSDRMRDVLQRLESSADLVVVDTAAALAVSDSLPLIKHASGLLMVVRMNRSASAAVRRMQKVIASAGGTVLGVVATGSGSGPAGYGYGYGYGHYYHDGAGKARRRRVLSKLRLPIRTRATGSDNGAVGGTAIPASLSGDLPAEERRDELDGLSGSAGEEGPPHATQRARVAPTVPSESRQTVSEGSPTLLENGVAPTGPGDWPDELPATAKRWQDRLTRRLRR